MKIKKNGRIRSKITRDEIRTFDFRINISSIKVVYRKKETKESVHSKTTIRLYVCKLLDQQFGWTDVDDIFLFKRMEIYIKKNGL